MGRTGTLSLNNMYAIFLALPSALVILKPDDPDFTVEEVNKSFLNLTGMNRLVLVNKPFSNTINKFVKNGYEQTQKKLQFTIQKVIKLPGKRSLKLIFLNVSWLVMIHYKRKICAWPAINKNV